VPTLPSRMEMPVAVEVAPKAASGIVKRYQVLEAMVPLCAC